MHLLLYILLAPVLTWASLCFGIGIYLLIVSPNRVLVPETVWVIFAAPFVAAYEALLDKED